MKTQAMIEMVNHQVPYEVGMLRCTFLLLSRGVPEGADQRAVLNANIESFCIHARNLIEFFSRESTKPKDKAGARHFTLSSYRAFKMPKTEERLVEKLNEQIAHLSYKRTTKDEEKILGSDRAVLLWILEDEIARFGKSLRDEYKALWPQEMVTDRIPVQSPVGR
jgi:hypothetical protein